MQRHTMILWSKAKNEEFESIAKKGFQILQSLKEYGEELSPNYFTGYNKANCVEFDGTYETFKEALKRGVSKEGNNVFEDIGYSISFFSSLDDDKSSGISMHLGSCFPRIKNTLVVNISYSLDILQDIDVADRVFKVFKDCCKIFNPFWGCIANEVNKKRYSGYINNNLPTTVHWLNYWGIDTVNQVGEVKIQEAPICFKEKIGNGYLLRLKQFPINDFEEENVILQNNINNYFNLI